MKSPKFRIRSEILRNVFSASNIQKVWRSKVRVAMRQQFIADGIENFDFHVNQEQEAFKLSTVILNGDYVPERPQRILVEKSKGLCRQLVIPSVRDAIVLQCLSDTLYSQIRSQAPTDRAFFEPKQHRFSSVRHQYGTFAAWINFQRELFKFSEERSFIVVTDIANYYDSISYIHLRNVISSISDADECIIDMLIFVLSSLLWQPDYMPRTEIGLPQMNLDAPRLLAHCFLYELDRYLSSNSDIDFVRYMDDVDIGVNSTVRAKEILKSVDLVLQTRQIRLNGGKTQILSKNDARKHFRIKENAYLDHFQEILDRKISEGHDISNERRYIQRRIRQDMGNRRFDDGNGEKILKRLITLASKANAQIYRKDLENILVLRPGVRENIFSFMRATPLTSMRSQVLVKVLESQYLVDDAARVDLANYLVETLILSGSETRKNIQKILGLYTPKEYYGFYGKIWLQSKYDTPDNILSTLNSARETWISSVRLGRIVGSFWPLFRGTSQELEYMRVIGMFRNSGCRDSIKFLKSLSSEKATFVKMFEALKNPNPSRGTRITHAKFLCLLASLKNDSVDFATRKNFSMQILSHLTMFTTGK